MAQVDPEPPFPKQKFQLYTPVLVPAEQIGKDAMTAFFTPAEAYSMAEDERQRIEAARRKIALDATAEAVQAAMNAERPKLEPAEPMVLVASQEFGRQRCYACHVVDAYPFRVGRRVATSDKIELTPTDWTFFCHRCAQDFVKWPEASFDVFAQRRLSEKLAEKINEFEKDRVSEGVKCEMARAEDYAAEGRDVSLDRRIAAVKRELELGKVFCSPPRKRSVDHYARKLDCFPTSGCPR